MDVWVWRDPGGKLRWGETRDFRDALGIVGHIDMAAANAMLGGSRQIAQEDVPRDFERYTAKADDGNG